MALSHRWLISGTLGLLVVLAAVYLWHPSSTLPPSRATPVASGGPKVTAPSAAFEPTPPSPATTGATEQAKANAPSRDPIRERKVVAWGSTALAGVVLDERGEPLPGADVRLSALPGRTGIIAEFDVDELLARAPVAREKTDGEGRFEIDVDFGYPYQLTAVADGYAPVHVPNCYAGEFLTVQLMPGGSLEVHVVSAATGNPADDCLVRVALDKGSYAPPLEGTTGANGVVRFASIAPGTVILKVAPAEGVSPHAKAVKIRSKKLTTTEFAVETGVGIRGIVRDAETSRPVQGAIVAACSLFQPDRSTVTDAHGDFLLEGAPERSLSVRVSARG